ncbi:hypothetical protein KJZ61_01860 [Candidatus Dependentiae bacterium]|nr:hypothetical protein [Candidatus Dependentiae bacterium]
MFTAMRTVFGVMAFLNSCVMNAVMDIDLCEDISSGYVAPREENQGSSSLDQVDMKSHDLSNTRRTQLMLEIHKLDTVHTHVKRKALEHFTEGYIKRCNWLDEKYQNKVHKSADVVPPMMYLVAEAWRQKIDMKAIIALNPDQFFDEACREHNMFSRTCVKAFFKKQSGYVWYTPEDALFCAIRAKNIIVAEQILLDIPDIDVRSSVGYDGDSLYESVEQLACEDSSYAPFKEMLESFCRDTLPKKRRLNE